MNRLNTITAFFKLKVKETLTYRGMLWLWMANWLMSFLGAIFIWRSASFRSTTPILSMNQIITYYFIGLLVWAICWWAAYYYIISLIKDGELTNFILKPFSFHWFCFAGELAWHTVNAMFFLIVFGLVFWLIKDFLFLSINFITIIYFALSMGLACLVTFEFNLALSTAAFWVINAEGLGDLLWITMNLLGCQIAPLVFYPKSVQFIIKILPFRYMYSFPLEIYLGQLSIQQIYWSFLLGIIWTIALYNLYKVFWQKGIKNYVGRGQ